MRENQRGESEAKFTGWRNWEGNEQSHRVLEVPQGLAQVNVLPPSPQPSLQSDHGYGLNPKQWETKGSLGGSF